MDDNFASIIKGIQEGRLLFDNLRLSIAYTLAHLWPEIFPVVLQFTLGLPLGLSPMQVIYTYSYLELLEGIFVQLIFKIN